MENFTQQPTNNVDEQFLSKWSWGGFLMAPIWAIASRQVALGLAIFVLSFIPFVGFAAMIYFGVKGRNFAWEKSEWESFEVFKQRQKLLDKVGIISTIVIVVLTLIFIAMGMVLLSGF